MRRTRIPIRGSFCLVLLLLACGLPGAAAPTAAPVTPPLTTPPAVPTEAAAPLQGMAQPLPEVTRPPFAPYEVARGPDLGPPPRYRLDPAAVANPTDLPVLDEGQRGLFSENGFVITAEPVADPYTFLERAAGRGQPLFITGDLVLAATQAAHQAAWQQAQTEFVGPLIIQLTETLTAAARAQYRTALEAERALQAQAALYNLAYFTVAGRLYDPAYPVEPAVMELVESELALIRLGGERISPLMGARMDYTPYARAESGFERVRVWYRTMGFPLQSDSEALRRQGQQILLLLDAIGQNRSLWERVATALAFFEGHAGPALAQWEAIEALNLPLDDFILTAAQLPDLTLYILPPPAGVADALWPQLVYNRVGTYTGEGARPFTAGDTAVGPVRLFPRVLDLAAVFGSPQAAEALQLSGDAAYSGYPEQIEQLSERYDNLDVAAWTQTRALGWLYGLQPLLASSSLTTSEKLPPFMQTGAWQRHQLETWQVGWTLARLAQVAPRTPTLKTPNTLLQATRQTQYAPYVAPHPKLYARLAAQTRQMMTGLGRRGLLSQSNADRLLALEQLLATVHTISAREIAGQALTPEETQFARELPGRLQQFTGDFQFPLTTPLYTDPTTGQRLVASLSGARPVYALAFVEGEQVVVVGVVFNFEESKSGGE